jgi:undecaprenyl-diphosphatase
MTKTAQPGAMMLSDLDVALTHGLNAWAGQSPLADRLMVWTSEIGVPLLIAAVALQWWQGDNKPHTRHILLATGFSFLVGLAINQVILLFVQRARPYDAGVTHLLIERSADFSFPSDHATATVAIAAAFMIHEMPQRGALFLAAAVLMVVSRVYVGTHYASDVLGGALTGVIAASLVRPVYRRDTRMDRLMTSIL